MPDPPTFAPTFVAHSVGAGEVTLRWAAPPASGPGSIVGYEVRDSAGGFDIVGAKVTSATFAGSERAHTPSPSRRTSGWCGSPLEVPERSCARPSRSTPTVGCTSALQRGRPHLEPAGVNGG